MLTRSHTQAIALPNSLIYTAIMVVGTKSAFPLVQHTGPFADSFAISVRQLLACSVRVIHFLFPAAVSSPPSLNSRRSIVDRGMEGFETGSFGLKVVDPHNLQVEPREFHAISFRTPGSQKQRASSAWRGPDHCMADLTFDV